jgi:hypothetical protein
MRDYSRMKSGDPDWRVLMGTHEYSDCSCMYWAQAIRTRGYFSNIAQANNHVLVSPASLHTYTHTPVP